MHMMFCFFKVLVLQHHALIPFTLAYFFWQELYIVMHYTEESSKQLLILLFFVIFQINNEIEDKTKKIILF